MSCLGWAEQFNLTEDLIIVVDKFENGRPEEVSELISSLFSFLPQVGDRLKPFHGARVCFLGFAEDERKHMEDILVENGGTPTDIEDPICTHVVSRHSRASSINF